MIIRHIILISLVISYTGTWSQSYVPQWNDGRIKVPASHIKAYAFPLGDVQLMDSPFKNAMEATANYLLQVEPDRLLSQFRSNAGLEPKGEIYGGWESAGLAGHSLGHYLSACSMQYAVSGDERYLQKVNYIVDELLETQRARGTGYVGAIPNEDSVWAEVKKGNITARDFYLNGAWSPFYTVHKIMAGLLDAYLYANNEAALTINIGIADWTGDLISGLTDSLRWKMLVCEYGGMNETLVNTYALTGNKKYLELSRKFQDHHIVDSLAMQINVLKGKHSNTQIPKITGVIRRYELAGDQKDFTTADFFWKTMIDGYTYVTGGNSNYERLPEYGKLNKELTDNTTETCNTYNMLKLDRHLFSLNPVADYMDYYENALFNHILASQNHSTGMVCYFVPLRMGTRKRYSNEFNNFTCCHGSGMENHVKYGEAVYSRGADGSLYVNLFIPSRLSWKEKEAVIVQQVSDSDPDGDHSPQGEKIVQLTINTGREVEFPVRIRKPYWAKGQIAIEINGKNAEIKEENGYLVMKGKWKNNDQIICTISMNIHTQSMPDNEDRIALFYGPYLLAGTFGDTEPDPDTGIPSIVTDKKDPNSWVERTGNEVFKTLRMSTGEEINLIPFHETQDEYYSVYWDTFSPDQWKEELKKIEVETLRRRALEKSTVDQLNIGDSESEENHQFEAEGARTGENHRKAFIRTNRNGSFSFTAQIVPGKENKLHCLYWGEDNRGRAFDILVDDQLLASVELVIYKGSKFHEIIYPLPEELTRDKSSVRLTFRARENNIVGPIYGIRMLSSN